MRWFASFQLRKALLAAGTRNECVSELLLLGTVKFNSTRMLIYRLVSGTLGLAAILFAGERECLHRQFNKLDFLFISPSHCGAAAAGEGSICEQRKKQNGGKWFPPPKWRSLPKEPGIALLIDTKLGVAFSKPTPKLVSHTVLHTVRALSF